MLDGVDCKKVKPDWGGAVRVGGVGKKEGCLGEVKGSVARGGGGGVPG